MALPAPLEAPHATADMPNSATTAARRLCDAIIVYMPSNTPRVSLHPL
jgi:hypothetical protein